MLKLSHFQSFSCASEPLGLKASLSDLLLDPEVPPLQRKGGMPCLGRPAGWWPGALLRWELQAQPDPQSLFAQPTEHQCGCCPGRSHSLSLKGGHCCGLKAYVHLYGRDFQAQVSAMSSWLAEAVATHCFPT